MPPKNTPNGFYIFMLEEQKKLKAQTNHAPSMREMPGLCKDKWKSLPADQKARYDNTAKMQKQRIKGHDGDWRMDNRRQIISNRRDPQKENIKRRNKEVEMLRTSWEGKDVRNIRFYVIDFQVMYDDLHEDHHLPMEIGLVSFTLNDGILKFVHRFIDPGSVPQGNRHLAVSHSENTHQIPLNFEHADANYVGLVMQIDSFLAADDKSEHEFPPVFCLSIHRQLIEDCLEFIYCSAATGEPIRLQKLYCLEDLVTTLVMQSGKTENGVSGTQVFDMLLQNRWDYTNSIRCFYHEEQDVSFCSLSIVRRYCFAIFDTLSTLLDFKLTKSHLPEEKEQSFTVRHPTIGFGDFKGGRREMESQVDSYHHQSEQPRFRNGGTTWARRADDTPAWKPPPVQKIEVELSDEEEEEGDEEEEETVGSVPAAQQVTLKELRKPKTPGLCVQASNIRPMGRGMAGPRPQVRPIGPSVNRNSMPRMVGRGIPTPGFVAPPPGFAPQDIPVMPAPGANFPPRGRGTSLGRGRGLLN